MNRRDFLGGVVAAGCLGIAETVSASPISKLSEIKLSNGKKVKYDENLVVFISDLHTNPGEYQVGRLRKVVADILNMRPLPKHVIALGDCAYLTGRKEEYALLKEIIAPIEEAGMTLTLGMGNHDRRDNFADAFPEQAAKTLVPGRYVYKVETPKADFIVLDSLQQGEDLKTWITPGAIDDNQRQWLAETLKDYKKPVFVCAHHPMDELKINDILLDCPACCGFIHGHNHRWMKTWFKKNYSQTRLVTHLGLPSTGHWGDIGYTSFRIKSDRAVATLHQSEFFFPRPVENPNDVPLQWKMFTEDHKGAKCQFEIPKI